MSITDELRKWAEEFWEFAYSKFGDQSNLIAIADRIDEEHQKAIRELNNFADASVLLPVDADGEYIHIGDVMEGEKIGGGYGEPFEVVGYVMRNGELEPMDEHRNPRKRKYSHHHHEPTVEDVLREMLYKAHIYNKREMELLPDLIAEYAAKLQLREDA